MLTASLEAKSKAVTALSFVLREMGNGVVRVELFRVLRSFDPSSVSHPDFLPLDFPLPPVLSDCIEAAGCSSLREMPAVREGRARAVCDGITEVYVWCPFP